MIKSPCPLQKDRLSSAASGPRQPGASLGRTIRRSILFVSSDVLFIGVKVSFFHTGLPGFGFKDRLSGL